MSSLSSAAPARPAEHSATPGPAAGVENRPANTTATLLPRPYVPERVTEPFTSAARESFSAMIEATGDNTRHISALQYYELRQWLTGRPTRTNVDRRARRHAKDNYTFYEGEGGKEGLYKKAGEGTHT
ncbi:uncharacterized protein K452DRAFT_97980 [Aplosporella prunicola CBS 121167]|uniref:Uncharacterized protein n=1 Tax=Aplosporella prunicola CBS 121167 TaxID=1176127 RepID=A0A6A6B122_9PEZI|nr:uncharacterized protein K452DRAFT_97980 [Aplosporella prunicola CBS 121167]KAF2137730.1 hypothetical protein K452DRAFT_97980 [Aplosporella prunicola CBS 121167]